MLEVYNDSTTAKRPSKGSASEIYTSTSVIMNYVLGNLGCVNSWLIFV